MSEPEFGPEAKFKPQILLQWFVFPMLVVVLSVGLYLSFRFLTADNKTTDDYLSDLLPVVKRLARVLKLDENNSPDGEGYNVLQNNGRIAHQVVDHVHFHLIPKRDDKTGLIVGWPAEETNFPKLEEYYNELKKELEKEESEKLWVGFVCITKFPQLNHQGSQIYNLWKMLAL